MSFLAIFLSPLISVFNYRSLMILRKTTYTWVCESLYANRTVWTLDLMMQITCTRTWVETCTNTAVFLKRQSPLHLSSCVFQQSCTHHFNLKDTKKMWQPSPLYMQVPIPEPGEKGRVREGFLYPSMRFFSPGSCRLWTVVVIQESHLKVFLATPAFTSLMSVGSS